MVDFRQIQGGRAAIVQFTASPLLVHAIDYTGIGGADSMTPTVSTDGGQTWQRLAGDPTGGGAHALFADPNSTNRLVVSDYALKSIFPGMAVRPSGSKFVYANSGNGCYVAGAFFDVTNIFVGTSAGLVVSTNGGGTFGIGAAWREFTALVRCPRWRARGRTASRDSFASR